MEIVGASGEGSITIKSLRSKVTRLIEPLTVYIANCGLLPVSAKRGVKCKSIEWNESLKVSEIPVVKLSEEVESSMSAEDLRNFYFFANIYTHPDANVDQAEMYEYCKSLEAVESALISGFYHKHFTLALNVIGSLAKGTLSKNVQALKSSYVLGCFPILDQVRYSIAGPIDIKYAYLRAKIVNQNAAKRNWPLVR